MDEKKFNKILLNNRADAQGILDIYNEYGSMIKIYVRCRFGNAVDADDILQDVFIKLLDTDWSKYDRVKYPKAWLLKITENLSLDYLKRSARDVELGEFAASSYDIEAAIADSYSKDILKRLDSLTVKIMVMHYWFKYTEKEISEELNMSYSAVRTRVSRAYRVLKQYLSDSDIVL